MKMKSKSLSEKIKKTLSFTIAIIALYVLVLQGYSIWSTVAANASIESTSDPFSFFSWKEKPDGCLLKDLNSPRPSRPSSLQASLDEPVLMDVGAVPVEVLADDVTESGIYQLDAPEEESEVTDIAEGVTASSKAELVSAASLGISESDSVTVRNSEPTEISRLGTLTASETESIQLNEWETTSSIPWDATLQSTLESTNEMLLPVPTKPIRFGERFPSSNAQAPRR